MKMLCFLLCALIVPIFSNGFEFKPEAIIVDEFTRYSLPSDLPPPPPVNDAARMARYVVHYSDWTTLSHISRQPNMTGLPLGRVYSMTDGPISMSTGVPYIYCSFFDGTPRDLKVDNRCSMSMSLAQGDFCKQRQLDAEDPRCPQVMLLGDFIFLQNNTAEWNFAANAMFTRHPSMKNWPKGHHFQFGKLDIKKVIIVDNIGGSKYPTVKDYFASPPPLPRTIKETNMEVKLIL